MSDPLAIYIHWPYCARICPYCDFNVYKSRPNTELLDAIVSDLKGWRAETDARTITSIHFGGGTPSLMDGSQVSRVISTIAKLWDIDPMCEIAIEANPSDATTPLWKAYKRAGINRLSLGVQTFQDPGLRLLGRDHDGRQARDALHKAVSIFNNVSLDLIFGWQSQDLHDLAADLKLALHYAPAHISAYQLTIEENTAFGRALARGENNAVSENLSADMYECVSQALTSNGYAHYEVSNFAKDNQRSRHNMAYWTGQDYLGVGPGAHGRVTFGKRRYATLAWAKPDQYVGAVRQAGIGQETRERLNPQDWADEYILMGLRISEGISLARYEALCGASLSTKTLSDLSDRGYLTKNGDTIRATEQGRLLLDKMTEALLVT